MTCHAKTLTDHAIRVTVRAKQNYFISIVIGISLFEDARLMTSATQFTQLLATKRQYDNLSRFVNFSLKLRLKMLPTAQKPEAL